MLTQVRPLTFATYGEENGMEITVKRGPTVQGATIGELSVNGVFQCYTLEDEVREPSKQDGHPYPYMSEADWVKSWKVQNKTAIPRGRYKIGLHNSPHFKCIVPILLDVPGYVDVLIHWGNSALDTDGCILVGQTKEGNLIYKSKAAWQALYPKISAALAFGQPVDIDIR
jgi:hypothetical protein